MAIDKFIPAIWSAKLLLALQKTLVYGQPAVVNRDYEGEIGNAGDTVKIHGFGAVSVFDYAKNGDMPPPETLTDEEMTLKIDQSKGFNFQIDDIDKAQQTPKIMGAAMADAAYRLADAADQFIAAHYVHAGRQIGSDAAPTALTKDNVYDIVVDMGTALTEKNVPKEGRFLILPPWAYGLILKDDRFTGTGGAGAETALANGQVGRAAGFAVMESNNVPHDGGARYKILAGHRMAWSFADQISSVEAYRPERRFGDAAKGLHVYGAKVVRPDALVCLTANK